MAMIIFAIALLLRPSYDFKELMPLPETGTLGHVLLTDDGVVAGYWYKHVPPGHAGAIIAKPFVFYRGKTIPLPLADGEFGHVLGGNDSMLVGDVETKSQHAWVPAIWTPDPVQGWKKAGLVALRDRMGRAECVSKDGTVWISTPEQIIGLDREHREKASLKVKMFDLAGVLDSGTLAGTKYSGTSIGFSRTGQRAGFFEGGKWRELIPGASQESYITAVSPSGQVALQVQEDQWLPMLYSKDKLQALPVEHGGTARWIGRGGIVAGHSTDLRNESKACLWKDGVRVDISGAIDGLTLIDALAVNERGQVLATTPGREWPQTRLFLLTPK
jgi:hypothetical protein